MAVAAPIIDPPPPPSLHQHLSQPQASTSTAPSLRPRLQHARTFYRRQLPPNLISFTSDRGKRLFRSALTRGFAENYFHLAGNFTTQSEPAFCGLGSLAMVLNALEVDPGRQWKGVWRWYTDENLDCSGASLESIKANGITFREFACLAQCNGLKVQAKRGDLVTREEFCEDLRRVCASGNMHMVVSFARSALQQTGDGHFSPVGAYHPDEGKVLVLDTARFKYPSYFADVDELFDAMQPPDTVTGLARGYFLLERNERRYKRPLALCRLTKTMSVANPQLARLFCQELPKKIQQSNPSTLEEVMRVVFAEVPALHSELVDLNDPNDGVDLAATASPAEPDFAICHRKDLLKLLVETKQNPLHQVVQRLHLSSSNVESSLMTLFLLALPNEVFKSLPSVLAEPLHSHRCRSKMSDLMADEIARLNEQLSSLMTDYCRCAMHRERVRRPIN